MAFRLNAAPSDPDEIAGYDYEEGEGRPRRGVLRAILVVLIMALFGGGLWVAYQAGRGHTPREVPLIRAELGATKARPEEPGGMAIPNQRMYIYGQGQGQTEKLLPPPETPLPRPARVAAAPEPPPAPAALEAPPEPPTAEAPAPVAPAPTAPTLPAPIAAVAEPVAAPVATAPAATPPGPPPAATAPASTGGYRLQLAAMRNAEDAKREWEKLRQANKDLLGNLPAAWPRADLGQRGVFYRVQAGPIIDAASAERICGELKRRNIGCILVRP
jgi:cell division septation protein DedD